jgi:hypothetical protein
VLHVLDPEVSACFFHHLGDGRVIHVADPWKQVVFDLKVQAAEEPCDNAAAPGEVHSGFRLVDGPRAFAIRPVSSPGSGNSASSTQCATWNTTLSTVPATRPAIT